MTENWTLLSHRGVVMSPVAKYLFSKPHPICPLRADFTFLALCTHVCSFKILCLPRLDINLRKPLFLLGAKE
jgi:hypothetical protein